MKKIMLYDPAIASTNLGDYVISDSARNQLSYLTERSFCAEASTHLPLSIYYMRLFKDVDYSFVLGSNLLKSTLFGFKRQWAISMLTSPMIKNCVLVGAGWWQYNNSPNLYTKTLYKKVLSKEYIHSVRDGYTERILRDMGIKALNTGCPSIWSLTEEHCRKIRTEKSDNVVFTVTDYNKNPQRDSEMIKIVLDNYNKVYFWPQGYRDLTYLEELCDISKIEILNPNLESYDDLLNQNIDYIGTRLHGGIRALQKGNRAIIVSIDNRANEMHEDFNIPVIQREDILNLSTWVNANATVDIHIPEDKISQWKEQFSI